MDFLDRLKVQAVDVATTVADKTQDAARLGQLQMQLRTLKGEERDALTDFGRNAHALFQTGSLAERSGELAGISTRIGDLRKQIDAKVTEIAELRGSGEDEDPDAPVESSAEELRDPEPPTSEQPPPA